MCWKCGTPITARAPIGRSQTCDSCGADTRSCRNCRFYSPSSYHECAERVADAVRDKERANFCDLFQINPLFLTDRRAGNVPDSGAKPDTGKKPDSRSAFDGLFGS